MNKLSDKLVEIRMGDLLEKRLKENRRFMQRQKGLLSLEDMTDLVRMYDAVKQLNTTLYGSNEYHEKDEGVLGALERVYYVIHNGIGYKLEFLGEDESDESITYILEGVDGSPEKRAKMLLGKILVDAE